MSEPVRVPVYELSSLILVDPEVTVGISFTQVTEIETPVELTAQRESWMEYVKVSAPQ